MKKKKGGEKKDEPCRKTMKKQRWMGKASEWKEQREVWKEKSERKGIEWTNDEENDGYRIWIM